MKFLFIMKLPFHENRHWYNMLVSFAFIQSLFQVYNDIRLFKCMKLDMLSGYLVRKIKHMCLCVDLPNRHSTINKERYTLMYLQTTNLESEDLLLIFLVVPPVVPMTFRKFVRITNRKFKSQESWKRTIYLTMISI